jgi:hypothetical protein
MSTPLADKFIDIQLTDNFTLRELLFADFYSPQNQERVLQSYYDDPTLSEKAFLLARHLQVIRDYLGCPLMVNIAYRPKWWELIQKRSGESKHVLFEAADIVSDNHSPKELRDSIRSLKRLGALEKGGLHAYSWGVHTDRRGYNARW